MPYIYNTSEDQQEMLQAIGAVGERTGASIRFGLGRTTSDSDIAFAIDSILALFAITVDPFIVLTSNIFAVLGMRLSARPYPEGPPLRDAGHARLLSRFAACLPSTVRMRTEVPLRAHGDLRAWDAEVAVADGTCKVEAETVLYDPERA